jgi:hypothetical protein
LNTWALYESSRTGNLATRSSTNRRSLLTDTPDQRSYPGSYTFRHEHRQ